MTRLFYIGLPILVLIIIGVIVYGTKDSFGGKVTFDPATAQKVQWDKPKTDEEWAEDVKAESFHIKSTGVLEEMKTTHEAKLLRVQEGMSEVFECRECIEFQTRRAYPDWTEAEIDAYYLDELAKATWEVEKLQQSVERMDNELRLREKGFVVVEGEDTGLIGSLSKPYAIREIHD